MINKKILLLIFVAVIISFNAFYYFNTDNRSKPANTPYSTLAEYNNSIDYSCSNDRDCVIKNVGNCCGAYPECVNNAASTDPDFVDRACSKEDLGGICGFPSIDNCRCTDSKCEGYLTEENF